MTCEASPKSTCSPEVGSGLSPPALPAGPTTDLFGRAPAPVNRSRKQESNEGLMTNETSGQSSADLFEQSDLPSSSVSRSSSHVAPSRSKTCKSCAERKPYTGFYANSKGQTRADCIECCKAKERQRKSGSTERRSASHKKWRANNRAAALITSAKFRAKQKGLAFDLDEVKERLQMRIDRGVCEATGIPFDLAGGRTWNSPSLDRIDPTIGYLSTNVRVVIFALNVMLNTWGETTLMDVAARLKAQRDEDENSLLGRWEERLRQRLDAIGSTESPLIWDKTVTPSGRVISRLRPWTPPTSASASTGSRWPTPTVADVEGGRKTRSGARSRELLLNGLMAPASASPWVTPSARDWKDSTGMATERPDGRSRIDQLPRQMAAATTPFGPEPGGSPVTTGKRGAPNPLFAFWLMGFPDVWTSGALAAMRSFRRSRRKSSQP